MAFGVTKWPLPCDPRGACFCLLGYAAGAVPPWKFFLKTTGALPPFQQMNTGLIVTFELEDPTECFYIGTIGPPALFVDLRTEHLSDPPYDPAPAATLRWKLELIATVSGDRQIGQEEARLPAPIGQPPAISTLPVAGPNLLPNPVSIEPRAWDAL